MTPEPSLTWIDLIKEAWLVGEVSASIGFILLLIGIRGIWHPFKASYCQAYSLLALVPFATAMFGANYLLEVFRDQSGHLRREMLVRFVGGGEAAMPLMVGCLCSSALMLIASILWMRSKGESADY